MITVVPSWFNRQVLKWFDKHGRHHLPWKTPVCPYRIWVSEIMLQQTQVATVIDYFERFMKAFPTLKALAKAPQDDVLALWAGLGYYARARNLHKTAQILIKDYQGIFPESVEELKELPGIGPSTAGAIVAQSFDRYAVILDGNVKRILSRFYCIPDPITDTQTLAQLWDYAHYLTPKKRVADYTQAIMDIGATLCTRSNPNCYECPLHKKCQAFLKKEQHHFPVRKERKKRPSKKAVFLRLYYKDYLLLEKRPNTGIWGGLYSLPSFETVETMRHWCKMYRIHIPKNIAPTEPQTHIFTHFQLIFEIYSHTIPKKPTFVEGLSLLWVPAQDLEQLGLPAPIRKTLIKETA